MNQSTSQNIKIKNIVLEMNFLKNLLLGQTLLLMDLNLLNSGLEYIFLN